MDKKQTIEAGNSLPPPLGSDCICYACGTAVHNGGDEQCACDAVPWWEERCKGCKHRERCDVALHPEAYPF